MDLVLTPDLDLRILTRLPKLEERMWKMQDHSDQVTSTRTNEQVPGNLVQTDSIALADSWGYAHKISGAPTIADADVGTDDAMTMRCHPHTIGVAAQRLITISWKFFVLEKED